MQIIHNRIVWENAGDTLPFPSQVADIVSTIDWSAYEWESVNLPISDATFCMNGGKVLYLTKNAKDEHELRQVNDFTGQFIIATYLIHPNQSEPNYMVQFLITVCEGNFVKAELEMCEAQDKSIFLEASKTFDAQLKRAIRITQSWWYRYLYIPWHYCVHGVGFAFIWSLEHVQRGIFYCMKKIAPL